MFKNICRPSIWIRNTSSSSPTSPPTAAAAAPPTAAAPAAAAAATTAAAPTAAAAAAPTAAAAGAGAAAAAGTRTTTTATIITTISSKQTYSTLGAAGGVHEICCSNNVRYFRTHAPYELAQKRLLCRSNSHPVFTKALSVARTMSSEPSTSESARAAAAAAAVASASASAAPKHSNRLAQEKSTYLLQHAHNPVDWYPWGDEAIERARRENKLIFLSVGYSTCHWCHVMEHESFESAAVAKLMNDHFVNIKVDREERPDIDQIYMQFVLVMNGHGGWPMSVWLTPELTPIMAGTYFPPHDRWGMPSFTNVLNMVSKKWNSNQAQLKASGHEVMHAIQRSLSEKSSQAVFEPGSADAKLDEALRIFKQRFDQEHGGFGLKPKFPEVSRLNFLFHAFVVTKDVDVLDMALQTLQSIGNGGIHDHLYGGFARYAVDRVWHVPHFEKMLYDQGQLMAAFANAYKITQKREFLDYADGIFRYLMKYLRHPRGGFYSGEDADSLPTAADTVKVEGAFYAWTWDEVKTAVLANAAQYGKIEASRAFEIYAYHYDLRPTGNVAPADDPHGHLKEKNILIVRSSADDTCSNFNINAEDLKLVLSVTNSVLHKIRDQRPRPHLDTKILCSWNGLVLSGLAKLANCGSAKREQYLQAAEQLVAFVREHLFDSERKLLLRSCYGLGTDDDTLQSNDERIEGFLVDYAFLIKGLLDYYKASLDRSALCWAQELQDIQDSLFWDTTDGAYFYSQANSANVIVRLKEDSDGAEPCGNSIAARNLILLAHYSDDDKYKQTADKLLEFFAGAQTFGYALPEMMSSLMLHEFGLDLVAVVGPDTEDTNRFVEICRKFFIPGMIILHLDPHNPDQAYNQRIQQKFKMVNGKPTVYICHDKVCRMPVTDPAKLEENLKENFFRSIPHT